MEDLRAVGDAFETDMGEQWSTDALLGQLWNCTDIMPSNLCNELDLPTGSTYAQGVRSRKAIQIQWHLAPNGGGEFTKRVDDGSHVRKTKHPFDSLDSSDQVPEWIAKAIREDGRTRGSLTVLKHTI